jgi:hypothetical protein
MKQGQFNIYRLAFYILGIYIIIDGLGSIIVYHNQPWFPDHMMRIIRMIVGAIVIYCGEKISRLT